MEQIKKFIDCYVPEYKCNFKCEYCYISTWENKIKSDKSKKIEYSPELIRKALSQKRWGGPMMLNFCGAGETLLSNELLPIIKELLEEGHYCMIVTNGTITPKFNEIVNFPLELRKKLFIKFSYHYLELKRLKLMDIFWNNVNKMKDAKVSFTVEVTPSDEYIPHIEDIKKSCLDNIGALPHITVCRVENGSVPLMSELSKEDFIKTWSEFKSELFDFKTKIFGEKRKEFCYAGVWSYTLELLTGKLRQCYRGKVIQNIYKDLDSKIKEVPVGCHCLDPHCWNGHAFIAFGVIPEIESPTFAEERNRIIFDSTSEWLQEDMKNFMSTRLYDTNKLYTDKQKKLANKKQKIYVSIQNNKRKLKKVLKRIKHEE